MTTNSKELIKVWHQNLADKLAKNEFVLAFQAD
jgi:hypothetical protein